MLLEEVAETPPACKETKATTWAASVPTMWAASVTGWLASLRTPTCGLLGIQGVCPCKVPPEAAGQRAQQVPGYQHGTVTLLVPSESWGFAQTGYPESRTVILGLAYGSLYLCGRGQHTA